MPNPRRLLRSFVALLIAGCASWCQAAQWALLVGVGDYPADAMDLRGPLHDVAALRTDLVERLGFAPDGIEVLLDRDATRANVLNALAKLESKVAEGDFVLAYFSGHGTSAFDANAGLPLAHDTGAFVPVDYAAFGTAEEKLASLIVGARDLRPTFAAIDAKGASGLILVDACYSANTSRSLHARERPTYRNIASGLEFLDPPPNGSSASPTPAYPYKRLVTLAASSAKEQAIDLNQPSRTLDGKPHGAFTDALLRTLRSLPNADANGDGRVSNWELFERVRTRMSGADIPHSPQFLPAPHEDEQGVAEATAFRSGTAVAPMLPPADTLVVRVEGDLPLIARAIADTEALRLAHGAKAAHDLLVRREAGQHRILTAFGDSVGVFAQEPDAAAALRQQPWIRRLVRQLGSVRQASTPQLHLRGETFEEGEQLTLSAAPPQAAHLLVLDIFPNGALQVLFPGHQEEFSAVAPDDPVRFEVQVTPPFGMDHVVAAAFTEPPSFYDRRLLAAGQIAPSTALHSTITSFLDSSGVVGAGVVPPAGVPTVAVRKVVTVPSSGGVQ